MSVPFSERGILGHRISRRGAIVGTVGGVFLGAAAGGAIMYEFDQRNLREQLATDLPSDILLHQALVIINPGASVVINPRLFNEGKADAVIPWKHIEKINGENVRDANQVAIGNIPLVYTIPDSEQHKVDPSKPFEWAKVTVTVRQFAGMATYDLPGYFPISPNADPLVYVAGDGDYAVLLPNGKYDDGKKEIEIEQTGVVTVLIHEDLQMSE